jgi:hypothetical protein
MENEFVPYEEALALKELGFDEECFRYYTHGSTNIMPGELMASKVAMAYNMTENQIDRFYIKAPLYQQAFRWFREKYNLLGNIYSNASGYCWEIHDSIGGTHRFDSGESGDCEESGMFTTYKKAELACIKKLIEILKNK